jgi:hypothetical protein
LAILKYSLFYNIQDEELTLDYGRKWWKAKSELDCECGSTECKYTGIPGEDIRLQFGRCGLKIIRMTFKLKYPLTIS